MAKKDVYILGISAFYHDSAAALIKNGLVLAAAEEERFSRKKHDDKFPGAAVLYCLNEANITLDQVDFIVFYEKPLLRFERILETFLAYAPVGIKPFLSVMPVWLKYKLHIKKTLTQEFLNICPISVNQMPKILYTEHHQSHAASAFFPSPFQNAAILCIDGVGEWASTSAWKGENNSISPLWEINFPHSLGLLYSSFTYYLGFKVNSAEYKVMGLAPYGKPKYKDLILNNLVDLKKDGTFRLNMKYFSYTTDFKMVNEDFCNLFGMPIRRSEEEKLSQTHMDIASSIQTVCEEIVIRLATTMYEETGCPYLCMAGGVALNCVANGKMLKAVPFKDVWIQPASSDAGGALGAALVVWYQYLNNERSVFESKDSMQGAYLGPSYSNQETKDMLQKYSAVYQEFTEEDLLIEVANKINEGKVIGWVQGRMEFGPRALGNRSIIGDPRNEKMQTIMNMKIKFRESFRPFAPAMKEDKLDQYFELDRASPYMLFVAPIKGKHRVEERKENTDILGFEKLKVKRSTLPAVIHIDYSARIQTVTPQTNNKFYKLLSVFEEVSGCPIVINTSFNIRGEPIVCTPEEAYVCFMRSDMDYLVLGNLILDKKKQLEWREDSSWKNITKRD